MAGFLGIEPLHAFGTAQGDYLPHTRASGLTLACTSLRAGAFGIRRRSVRGHDFDALGRVPPNIAVTSEQVLDDACLIRGSVGLRQSVSPRRSCLRRSARSAALANRTRYSGSARNAWSAIRVASCSCIRVNSAGSNPARGFASQLMTRPGLLTTLPWAACGSARSKAARLSSALVWSSL